ncbi:MAG TPA: NifU family protein [Erysipelotrichaceae bacterium]|nr:NifU family protein [Erysipelotrichaceae bacterium]
MKDDSEKLIIATLDKIRHFMQRDGGDIEFISFVDGIVTVKLHGACQDCIYADNDVKGFVEIILQEEVPGVVEVKLHK